MARADGKCAVPTAQRERQFVRLDKIETEHQRGADYPVGFDTYWLLYDGNEKLFDALWKKLDASKKRRGGESQVLSVVSKGLVNESVLNAVLTVQTPVEVQRVFERFHGDTYFTHSVRTKIKPNAAVELLKLIESDVDDVVDSLECSFE
jgi:hypothetical protein